MNYNSGWFWYITAFYKIAYNKGMANLMNSVKLGMHEYSKDFHIAERYSYNLFYFYLIIIPLLKNFTLLKDMSKAYFIFI
jgi:hypothetical protein